MDLLPSANGCNGQAAGTGLATPHGEGHGAPAERSAEPSEDAAHQGPAVAGTPAAPTGTGTRDARGRFTFGNTGRPRRRTGPPSANGANGRGTVTAAAPAPPASGRDAAGRFARGNLGGPGNPFARRVAALRQALLRAVTEQDVADLAGRLLASARGGDVAAMKLLLAYVLGRPAEVVDPDTLDLKELQLYQQSLAPADELHGMLHRIPPEFGLVALRTALPCFAANLGSELLDRIAEDYGETAATDSEAAAGGAPTPPDRTTVTKPG